MLAMEHPLSVRTHKKEAEKESKPKAPRSTLKKKKKKNKKKETKLEPFPKPVFQLPVFWMNAFPLRSSLQVLQFCIYAFEVYAIFHLITQYPGSLFSKNLRKGR